MDLELQLRQAEQKRQELERQHQEALQALRTCAPSDFEARQSRVRELEKKVALETVRCEELQLELSTAANRASSASSARASNGSSTSPHHGRSTSTVAASATTTAPWGAKGTEIERIMAKIEQDNRILAELEHSRSTTLGELKHPLRARRPSTFARTHARTAAPPADNTAYLCRFHPKSPSSPRPCAFFR